MRLESLPYRILSLLLETLAVALAVALAYLLRFNFSIPPHELRALPGVILIVAGARALVFLFTLQRHPAAAFSDNLRVVAALTAGSFLLLAGNAATYFLFTGTLFIPLTIIVLEFLISAPLITALRTILPRPARESDRFTCTLIIGEGPGALRARDLLVYRQGYHPDRIIIAGELPRNAGPGDKIPAPPANADLLRRYRVNRVVLTRNDLSAAEKEELLDFCLRRHATLLCLPSPAQPAPHGHEPATILREISLGDFMTHNPIPANHDAIRDMVAGKSLLLTGAAGKLGKALTTELTNLEPAKIILVDQDEQGIVDINYELPCALRPVPSALRPSPCALRPVLCDITDAPRMRSLFEQYRPEIVIHAASYNNETLLEENPEEAERVNVKGTETAARLALEYGAERFVLTSVTGVTSGSGVFVQSKRKAEAILQSLKGEGKTAFMTVRLPSSGQTYHQFTPGEAAPLLLEAMAGGNDGDTFLFTRWGAIRKTGFARKMLLFSGLRLGPEKTKASPGAALHLRRLELPDYMEKTEPTLNPSVLKLKE